MAGAARVVSSAILVLALAGCATGYQPMGFGGGFEELKLSADTYRISVRANAYSSPERAQNIALLRASELTLQSGFDRFVIVGGDGIQDRYAGSTPVVISRVGHGYMASGGDAIEKPSGNIVIRMVARNDPAYAKAIDARLIDQQLRPRLTR
jgi:hypothetical protein